MMCMQFDHVRLNLTKVIYVSSLLRIKFKMMFKLYLTHFFLVRINS